MPQRWVIPAQRVSLAEVHLTARSRMITGRNAGIAEKKIVKADPLDTN